MKRMLSVLVAVVALTASALAGSASASGGKSWFKGSAEVTVVHGVPDLKVDVYVVNNLKRQRLDDVDFKTVATLDLKPGLLYIAILPADDRPFSWPIFQTFKWLERGDNLSAVAHLDAGGKPTFSLFDNDTSDPGSGNARVVVRHLAAAPAVDIQAGGSPVIQSLANPNEATLVVPAGTYPIGVAPAGSPSPVFGPVPLTFGAGTTTVVYAVGSLAGGSFTPLVQTL
jgi:hypothetical protein